MIEEMNEYRKEELNFITRLALEFPVLGSVAGT